MTEEIINNNKIVKACYDNLHNFTNIFIDGQLVNDMPSDKKITVFCQSNDDEGFLINTKTSELGLEALIVKKWILHSKLEELAGFKIKG